MPPPIPIPDEVQTWLREVFASCNLRVAELVSTVPTTHETPLDMTFVQHFLGVSAPHAFDSGWSVHISTHYLGGGRHWSEWPGWPMKWEIADIGFLVLFRQAGQLIRSKVALLQSKRLYPDELELEEDTPLDYMQGFGRLMSSDEDWGRVLQPRTFTFSEQSRYRALISGVSQYQAIASYEQQRDIPVYYLLYNPLRIPSTAVMPIMAGREVPQLALEVGCRVVPAQQLRIVMDREQAGRSPAYGQLRDSLPAPFDTATYAAGWPLEHFVVDLVLDCQAGYVAAGPNDNGLDYLFNRRSGPISAALAVTIDAP
jgi:hypothetical protein